MIYEGHKAGSIETDEKNYMYNVLSFNDKKIKDIMRKKEQIVTIDIDSNTKEILEKIKASKYSRMPVYMDTIDNIVGILSIKDLVVARANNELIDIKDVLREPTFVSENAIIDDVFRDMQKEQHGMAIVQDKHHKTLGIVTLEDIIEEILGEIYDEHEKRESAKENIEK
jgi:putative hemolysin